MTTVGYGDISPNTSIETWYNIVVGAVGATACAAVISTVSSFVTDGEICEDNTDHKLTCVKWYMDSHNISRKFSQKVQEYFMFITRDHEGINEESILNEFLPDHIRSSVILSLTQPMVFACKFFKNCPSGFVRALMLSMEQQLICTQSIILDLKSPSSGMYFIKKGIVDLFYEPHGNEDMCNVQLSNNDCFAEECLLKNWTKNPFIAAARTDCELWFLSRANFCTILHRFPHAKTIIMEDLKNRSTWDSLAQEISTGRLRENKKANHIFFIHPHGLFLQYWSGLVLSVILYVILIIPFRVAFMENYSISLFWLITDYLCDLILITDAVLRAIYLAYVDVDGHLVTDRKKIWKKYKLSKKLKWHILSAVPIEIASTFQPSFCPFWRLQAWSSFRLNRFLRVTDISLYINKIESSLLMRGIKVPKNSLTVGKLFTLIVICAHLFGCIFFVLANYNQHAHSGDPSLQLNWANTEGLLETHVQCPGVPADIESIIRRYIASIYWSVATLTTVGYGDITPNNDSIPEVIFTSIILVIGTLIYTYVITLLEGIVSQLDVTSTLHQVNVNRITQYVRIQGIPDVIETRVLTYYDTLWRTNKGVKGRDLLSYLPRTFKAELSMEMLQNILAKSFFLKDATDNFVKEISNRLSLETYLPKDTLFVEGEPGNILFFVSAGAIDCFTSSSVKFRSINSGNLVGEASFFLRETYLFTAVASDACEIFELNFKDFWNEVLKNSMATTFLNYIRSDTNLETLVKEKNDVEKMMKNLNSSKMSKMMSTEEISTIPKGVILPDTALRFFWDFIAFISLLIYAFIIPYQLSFDSGKVGSVKFFCYLVLDIFFIIDVYARVNHFAIMKDGLLLTEVIEFRRAYLADGMVLDMIASCPMSTLAVIAGVNDSKTYGFLRMFQLLRLLRFAKYFNRSVELLNVYGGISVSTASIRITQVFLLVVIISHWFASIYHFIGESEINGWINHDEMNEENDGRRYLRSLFWATYTVTTVGYGTVPIKTNLERAFAMFAMVVAAVICDAGITAVLSSIIGNIDFQAGTNSRRLQCSKQYMKSQDVPQEIQEKVFNYYNYADVEIKGVNEEEVFFNISRALKNSILQHFCSQPLRCYFPTKFLSEGEINYVVNSMSPHLAVPGEKLSEIGKECTALYVLQRGEITVTNINEQCWKLPPGAVIGHVAIDAFEEDFRFTNGISGCFHSMLGFKGKFGYLYIVVNCGKGQYRTPLCRTKKLTECYDIQFEASCKAALFSVRGWRKNKENLILGTAKIDLTDCDESNKYVDFKDDQGRKTGSVKMTFKHYSIDENDEIIKNCEKTAVAESYCHLYKMEKNVIDEIQVYVCRSKIVNVHERMPPTTHCVTDGTRKPGFLYCNDETEQRMSRVKKSKSAVVHPELGQEIFAVNDEQNGSTLGNITTPTSDENRVHSGESWDWDNIVPLAELKSPGRNKPRRRSTFFEEWDRSSIPRTK